MGMFDSVNYKEPCPKCGSDTVIYQSKAGLCVLGRVEPYEVPWFDGYCQECKHMETYITQSVVTARVEECVIRRCSDDTLMASEHYLGNEYKIKVGDET